MNRVTASGSGRLLQCSGHLRLPWLRETSTAAQEGTDLHAVMETKRYQEHPRSLAAWDAWKAWQAETGFSAPVMRNELAMALNLEARTARELSGVGHRDYSAAMPHEVPGTADMVCELVKRHPTSPDQVWCVVDWKFGQEPVEADSAQMRTLAAMVALMHDAPSVIAVIVQAPPDGTAWVRSHEFSRDDLMAHVDMMAESMNEVREGAMLLQRGSECRYCPAAHACPSQLAAMSAIVAPGGPGPITPERAGQIWAEVKQAKKRLDAIEDACKAMAAGDGLPLPGGKRLVVVQRSRTSMDAKQLEAIARGHGASDDEINACSKTTTYTTTQEIKA
jgi:hypothetical protein